MSIHTKTAIESIKRSPFQAISAIFVLSLTFFVATMVSVIFFASENLLTYFETRPQIISFIKNEADEQSINNLQQKLQVDSRIKDLKFVSKEEALEIYKKSTADNPLLAELVSPTIFPASIEFSVTDLKLAEQVIEEVKTEDVVQQVGFTANIGGDKSLNDVVSRLKTISNYIRIGGIVFVSALGATSFIVLLIIISMRMNTRKGEIEILSLIGATPSFVSSPIIIEGLIYSLAGVTIGWTLSLISWLYVTPMLINYFNAIPVLPHKPADFFLLFGSILLLELVVGFIIALSGSFIAVKRSLKKVR